MEITLYEFSPTRSMRCRWTLAEAGVEYESVEDRSLFGSDRLRALHPLGKLPVAVIDGRPLFESAAICTYVADHAPGGNLVAKPGSWGRALHDQWVAFCLSEMEAWLWANAINTFVLSEEKRIDACLAQNVELFRRSAEAVESHLENTEYFVEDRFTVTDIIVGWMVNWGQRAGHLEGLPASAAYLERLRARPHCPMTGPDEA